MLSALPRLSALPSTADELAGSRLLAELGVGVGFRSLVGCGLGDALGEVESLGLLLGDGVGECVVFEVPEQLAVGEGLLEPGPVLAGAAPPADGVTGCPRPLGPLLAGLGPVLAAELPGNRVSTRVSRSWARP